MAIRSERKIRHRATGGNLVWQPINKSQLLVKNLDTGRSSEKHLLKYIGGSGYGESSVIVHAVMGRYFTSIISKVGNPKVAGVERRVQC